MTLFDKLTTAGVPPQDAAAATAQAIDAHKMNKIERKHHRDNLFKAAWSSKLTTQQIGDAMGISREAVRQKAYRWGLPRKGPTRNGPIK